MLGTRFPAHPAEEHPMEPGNRPYVDPSTAPGDEGTEEWADKDAPPASKTAHSPSPDEKEKGSPADVFTDSNVRGVLQDEAER